MKLMNNEREVLEYIEEGIGDVPQLSMFMKMEDAHIKNIMEKLEFLKFITIRKYGDEWHAEVLNENNLR